MQQSLSNQIFLSAMQPGPFTTNLTTTTDFLLSQQPGSSNNINNNLNLNNFNKQQDYKPQLLPQQSSSTPIQKNSKQGEQICTICGADADGLHYNALSCRSCNAFFRRAVTFKQTYVCRKDGNCDVNQYVRCACRACRFKKCLQAGMLPSAVQPRRDPTGSQKNRKPPKRRRPTLDGYDNPGPSTLSPVLANVKQEPTSVESNYQRDDSPSGSSEYPPSTSSNQNNNNIEIKPEITVNTENKISSTNFQESLTNDDGEEFDRLVTAYHEHLILMNRAMISIDDFLNEPEQGPKFKKMTPYDVEKLSTVELSGLLYWLEKQHPFKLLDRSDREALLKRYSVRKLSLDHFYQASKHKNMIKDGNFAMLNNTYVPPNETGFEGITDDEKTKQAKFDILRPTLDRLWATIVIPFNKMRITDAEIVTLQMLLLWSSQNNRVVSEPVKEIMKKRREWAIARLFEHYENIGISDPIVRLGEVILLLPEIEVVCDLHCTDFQVAKLFQFCDSLSSYWYDKWCYTACD